MSTAAPAVLRSGEILGGFRVEDVIGVGGMAIVYRAEQISLGRAVALKVLSSRLTSDHTFRERFRREGTHAASLEHPNIVPVYDSGEEQGLLYLAMRLVEGTNLAELIQTRGLTADQTIELLRPIASALDTAHAAGLIHRDVKPQNVLITSSGHPYLADFGVAKGSNTYGLTATGGFVGSVNYAAPEQINGMTLTPASDVYALTAVLYQCLTGEVPYPRETDAGVMQAHLTSPPPTLPAVNGVDSDFHTVFARGMAKDPGSRYGHAGDLLNAASLCVGRLPSSMRAAVPAFPAPQPKPPKRADSTQIVDAGTSPIAIPDVSPTTADRRRPAVEAAPPPVAPRVVPWRTLGLVAGAVGLLAVLLVVLLAGGSGGSSANASLTVRSAALSLKTPAGWHESSAAAPLKLASLAGVAKGGVSAQIGRIVDPPPEAAGHPASLFASRGAASRESLANLATGQARLYTWPADGAAPAIALWSIATSSGEMAFVCEAPSSSALIGACAPLAAGLSVTGAQVEYPGADPQVAASIARASKLRDAALTAAASLQAHTTLSSRAGALSAVATADTRAAQDLSVAGRARRYASHLNSLAAAFRGEAAVASALARAARKNDRVGYAAARGHLAAAGTAIAARLSPLRALGFRGLSARAMSAPGLPPRKKPRARRTKTPSTSPVTSKPAPSVTPSPAPVSPTPVVTPSPRPTPQRKSKSSPQPSTIISSE